MVTLPRKRKLIRRISVAAFMLAIASPLISLTLLFSAVYAQSTPCLGASNAIVFNPSFTNGTIQAGTPFSITIYMCNSSAQIDTTFNGIAHFTDNTGSISPTTTSTFTDGVWTGTLTITKTALPDTITAFSG